LFFPLQQPIGRIIADANAKGEVRAYVDHPQTHFPLNEQGKLNFWSPFNIAPIIAVAVIVLPIAADAVGHV
jgi:redox-regulated HSP33 family molecular chaperone